MEVLWIFVPGILAGLCQGISGLGSGQIVMLFYPIVLGMLGSASVLQCTCVATCLYLVVKYRKHIRFKIIIRPLIFYFPFYLVMIRFAAEADVGFLTFLFGVVIILTAFYMMFFSEKFRIRPSLRTEILCAALGGTIDAFFGNGGLPIIVFLLSVLDDKEEYIGTVQTYFLATCTFGIIVRIQNGLYTAELIPYTIASVVALMIGVRISVEIVKKVNTAQVKKFVCICMAFAGVVLLANNWTAAINAIV